MSIIGIIVAAIIGMALGALWYSPLLLGNQWMQCLGKTKETLGSETLPMIGSIIASVLTAVGIALIHSMVGVNDLLTAISIGLVLGFLIIYPAFLSDNLFCGWGGRLLCIQTGYRVLSVLLMSVVIYLIG